MARARQYADRVNVIKMVKVNGRWPFVRIVERNGRIVRDHVWVDGQDEHHPEGATTSNGTKTGSGADSRSRATISFFPLPAQNRSSSMPLERALWPRLRLRLRRRRHV
jgi:hypothetical protein